MAVLKEQENKKPCIFSKRNGDGGGAGAVEASHTGVTGVSTSKNDYLGKSPLDAPSERLLLFSKATSVLQHNSQLPSRFFTAKGCPIYLAKPPVRVVGLVDDHHLTVLDPGQALFLVS